MLAEHRVRRDLCREADSIYVSLDSISVPRNGRLELAEIDTIRYVTHDGRPGDARPSTAFPRPSAQPDEAP